MSIKTISQTEMSSIFFKAGLALELKKISPKQIEKIIPLSKLDEISSVITGDEGSWDDFHITPGETLQAALEIHGILQADLAKRLNVSSQKINDLVKGRVTLSPTWAKRIGKALNVSYKNFL